MSALFKLIYMFNTISIKISGSFSVNMDIILKLIWKGKDHRASRMIIKKNKARKIIIPIILLSCV